jgi:hypothetical protein
VVGISSFVSKNARKTIEENIKINHLNSSVIIKDFKIRAGGWFTASFYTDKGKEDLVGKFEKSIFINANLIKLNPFGLYLRSISFDVKEHKEEKVN